MSNKPGIGLTAQQAKQLMTIQGEYRSKIGRDFSDPAAWFSQHVSNYLSAVSVEAELENSGHGTGRRRAAKLRRDSLIALKSRLGRQATAEDLTNELSRFVMVPEFLVEAIRRDLLLLATGSSGRIS